MESSSAETRNVVVEQFNSKKSKPYMSLRAMLRKKPYDIVGCRRIVTQYGERISFELPTCYIYLPQRYSSMTDEAVKQINDGGFCIVNEGEEGKSFKLRIHSKGNEEVQSQNKLSDFTYYYQGQ